MSSDMTYCYQPQDIKMCKDCKRNIPITRAELWWSDFKTENGKCKGYWKK